MKKTRAFFSFYFTEDRHRARQVMAAWLSGDGREATPFISREALLAMIEGGIPLIYQWIEEEIAKADVSVVLIGQGTAGRHFVEYEIAQSIRQRKPVLGVRVHGLPDEGGGRCQPGVSPLFPMFPIYDWDADGGPEHLGAWGEAAISAQAGTTASFAPMFHAGLIRLPEGL